MKFEDFQAPVLFSSTFKALNLGEKKFQVCVGTLLIVVFRCILLAYPASLFTALSRHQQFAEAMPLK